MSAARNGVYGAALVLAAAGLGGCASSMTETGVKMGDSYAQVLAVVSRNNSVIKQVDAQGFRAQGYSTMFKDCRIKY